MSSHRKIMESLFEIVEQSATYAWGETWFDKLINHAKSQYRNFLNQGHYKITETMECDVLNNI